MSERYSLEKIREYWDAQARMHGEAHEASWSDRPVIEMEIAEILRHLEDGDRVLDVGCANGFSTVQYAAQRGVRVRGVDFIPAMIESARSRMASLPPLPGSLEFQVGDVMSLDEPAAAYDKVITTRVLINLHPWEKQRAAINECIRVLRAGGLLILSEATLQGWERLNRFRSEWGLPEIPVPPFNSYLDEQLLLSEFVRELELVAIKNFSSTYYVGTRVIKPIIAQLLGRGTSVADPLMEWNHWFSQLPACGDYGTQKLFVFRKH